MTATYSEIIQQIETLQRQAETARMQEVAGVVSRIKDAIAFYELTAADLGFAGRDARVAVVKNGLVADTTAARRKKSLSKGRKIPAKYRDAEGNTWAGRGLQPRWFKEAIAGGKTPESLLA